MDTKTQQWYPGLLFMLHLTYLVDTYNPNSTSPSSTPTITITATTTMIGEPPTSSPTTDGSSLTTFTPVSTEAHYPPTTSSTTNTITVPNTTITVPNTTTTVPNTTITVPNTTTQEACIFIYDTQKRSLLCRAEILTGCPAQIKLGVNLTDLEIKNKTPSVRETYRRRTLHNDCFKEMTQLVHLTINNFGLCELVNDTFSELTALEDLDLSHNCIEDISYKTFMGLNQLITLNLSHNKIKNIDKVFNLPKLAYLNLAYNHLVMLPDGVFQFLPGLRVLYLDGNDLSSLGSGSAFLGLDRLREMHMSECRLRSPPHTVFDHTQSLDSLYLSNNKMDNIPSYSIRHLYFLQLLDLSKNAFTDIPEQAFQGLALQRLDLSSNSINTIAQMAFRNFRTEELYLQNNRIKFVPRQAVEILARDLFIVDLSDNQLEGDRCIFPRDLIYLQKLNLSGNDLPHIPDSIHHLYHLQTLDLSNNHISTLNDTELKLVGRLELVYLHGNPWICDCEIRELKHVLEKQKNQYSVPEKRSTEALPSVNMSKVVCERPLKLSGVSVISLPEKVLSKCASTWGKVTPVFLYIICTFIIILILALVAFMWQKRHEMAYGRFCIEKGKDSPTSRQSHSPIKVISNTAAGAPDLTSQQCQGPVKNQAWESALVISNPHSKMTLDDGLKNEQAQNGRLPGAETIL